MPGNRVDFNHTTAIVQQSHIYTDQYFTTQALNSNTIVFVFLLNLMLKIGGHFIKV